MSEATVIGGGLAGGAVATLLGTAGRRVHLIEREPEPTDKVCGEFLSIEAQRMLARCGLDLDHLGASRINKLVLAWGDRTIARDLPFVARGLSRRRLDRALLAQAEAAGARIDRGVAVRSIAGHRIDTTAGSLTANLLLLASGKHDVRGAPRATEGCDTGYVGFKTHWRLSARATAKLAGSVNVILFEGGYAGLQLIEDDIANLCLLVDKLTLASTGGGWPNLFARLLQEPQMALLLGDAEALSPKPQTISGVPYGFLQRRGAESDLYRLGDQAAVIPSFCGEGMAIALYSALTAAAVITAGGSAADHQHTMGRNVSRRVKVAMALQRHGQGSRTRPLLWAGMRAVPALATAFVRLTRVPEPPILS